MLADPQTITIAATPNTLPRVGTGVNLSTYRKEDSNLQLEISHTYGKTRNRRAATIIQRKIAADPLISAQNIEYKLKFYLVVDEPLTGYSVTERKDAIAGFITWLTASSNANLIAILGGQS